MKMKQEKWLRRWSIRSMSSEKGMAIIFPCLIRLIFCESSWLIYLGACKFICFFKHNLNSTCPGLFGHFFPVASFRAIILSRFFFE